MSHSDYIHAQPEDVRRFIFKAMYDRSPEERGAVRVLIQEKYGDRYTEEEIDRLYDAALYLASK